MGQVNPDLGWRLFATAFREPQQLLWAHAERCLYYQYHAHFDRVAPYLERIRKEAGDLAGPIWGRLATLACLAGHLPLDLLLQRLAEFPTDDGWVAAAEVFTTNLASVVSRARCCQGLTELLHRTPASGRVLEELDSAFHAAVKDEVRFGAAFPSVFLHAWCHSGLTTEPRHCYEWLGVLARRDAPTARDLLERLADWFEQGAIRDAIHSSIHSEPLVGAMVEILRDADQSDDPAQIRRAIALQDRLFKLNVRGMEQMLERA